MASLGMNGPYDLTNQKIDAVIKNKSAGNYALGYVQEDKTFIVQYVGRSDSDLNSRIKTWGGNGYKSFKYAYATSPKAAFTKECENYHDFGGKEKLDNKSHPDRPGGSGWKCPKCDIFD